MQQVVAMHKKLIVNAKPMAHEFYLFTLAISLQKPFLQNLISSKINFMKIWSLMVLIELQLLESHSVNWLVRPSVSQ